jgi:hypothetical protein
VFSYVVGGGFHSLHEVLAPAQYSYHLIPGYNVKVPEVGVLASPPNYSDFFIQQAAIDPEFNARRQLAWTKYLTYFKDIYAPLHLLDFTMDIGVEIAAIPRRPLFFTPAIHSPIHLKTFLGPLNP